MSVTKEQLLAPRPHQESTVEVDGVGTFRIRALSRAEVLRLRDLAAGDLAAVDAALIAAGLVEPALSPDEVAAWCAVAPVSEIEPVSNAIMELSGLSEQAAKAAERSFRN